MSLEQLTEEALNQQVQSLAKQGKFSTAAEIIADWSYWDMVGRYDTPARPQGEPLDVVDEQTQVYLDGLEAEDEESSLPEGLMRDKIIGEFGVRWGNGVHPESEDDYGQA